MVQEIEDRVLWASSETIETLWARRLTISLMILGLILMALRNWQHSISMVTDTTSIWLQVPPFNLPSALSFVPTSPSSSGELLHSWLKGWIYYRHASLTSWTSIFELTRLSSELQRVLATLLLLPLSALVTALCRNLIGLVTFGTFVPPLLALALISTPWQVGIVMIAMLLIMGFGLRRMLEPLKLLMLPRLGILLTFAVWCSVMGMSILNFLDPSLNGQTILLPMVIVTGLIERLFLSIEEDGIDLTNQRLVGTVVVGLICYLVLNSAQLAQFVLTYPEAHFCTIALMIWLGRYSGYRISELWRFRELVLSVFKTLIPTPVFDHKLPPASRGIEYTCGLGLAFLQELGVILSHQICRLGLTLRNAMAECSTSRTQTLTPSPISVPTLAPYWCWPWQLKRLGILGINRRNSEYILPHNQRSSYPLVDNKILTKEVCEADGISCPETYIVIETVRDIENLAIGLRDRREFVIKPARGSGGKGILVIVQHNGLEFTKSSGTKLSLADIKHHLSTILSGSYSLSQQPDVVIIEERVRIHPAFDPIAVGGTPDIRVIVFQGVPIMAMTRLPTRLSQGRANLHQGAIAAAIDLVSGCTSGGVYQNQVIQNHPDTGYSLEGVKIPHWSEILTIAMKLGHSLDLGYIGVDLVLDTEQGPVVLDVNARPGLAIQIANGQGLQHRLAFIAAQPTEVLHCDRCLELLPQLVKTSEVQLEKAFKILLTG